MTLLPSMYTLLLITYALIVITNLTSATTVKLLRLKDAEGDEYPEIIMTDDLNKVKEDKLNQVDEEGNKLYSIQEITNEENPKENENPLIVQPDKCKKINVLSKNDKISAIIVEVQSKNLLEEKPTVVIDGEDEDAILKNKMFKDLRSELDTQDETKPRVMKLKLLPNIDDTQETYWLRIEKQVQENAVIFFKEYILKNERILSNKINTNEKDFPDCSEKKFLMYIVYAVEKITKKLNVMKTSGHQFQDFNTNFLRYIRSNVPLNSIVLNDDKYYEFIVDQIINGYNDFFNLGNIRSDVIEGIKDEDSKAKFIKDLADNEWLREIKDYDPLYFESIDSYNIRCYKRGVYPLTPRLIKKYFNRFSNANFSKNNIMISTILLRVLFEKPNISKMIEEIEKLRPPKRQKIVD